jgi:hypothetical protein
MMGCFCRRDVKKTDGYNEPHLETGDKSTEHTTAQRHNRDTEMHTHSLTMHTTRNGKLQKGMAKVVKGKVMAVVDGSLP